MSFVESGPNVSEIGTTSLPLLKTTRLFNFMALISLHIVVRVVDEASSGAEKPGILRLVRNTRTWVESAISSLSLLTATPSASAMMLISWLSTMTSSPM